ncbi:uncharacterized protein [Amphiura filiformis]|uniref:uncharacterized protein n=1 Tax=Amphiura filiformis TaxID=82378 RepID=UPI003B219C14
MLHQGQFTWICPNCALPNFSDSFFDSSDCSYSNLFDSLSDIDNSELDEANDGSSNATTHPARLESTQTKEQHTAKPKHEVKSKLKKRKFNIMTINCQGLKGKQRQKYLASIFDTEKPDVVMGQESKLDGSYTDSEVFPEGYLVKRKDRDANGGGVFIAYKDNIVVNEVKGVGIDSELVMFKPPSRDTTPILSLEKDLEKIFKQEHVPKVILTGDFNLPSIDWGTYSLDDNPQYGLAVNEAMLDLVNKFNLERKVLEPTRLDNILDLILTTVPECVKDVMVIPGMSDHEAVTAECDTNIQTNKKKPRAVHIYRKANIEGIEKELNEFSQDFFASNKSRSTSENWDHFKATLECVMTNHIPTKTISGRWNLPWMNDDLKRLMKKRRRRYDAWKKYGLKTDLDEYNQLKKEVNSTLKVAHNDYVKNMFVDKTENQTDNPAKKLWGYVKSLKMDKIGIPSLVCGNKLFSQAKQKAEVFFATIQICLHY